MSGAEIRIEPGDYVLASFPKSGSTWIRFLLANLMADAEPIDFHNYHRHIPDIHVLDDAAQWRRHGDFPRIIKTHLLPQPEYANCIYVVRDPRACLTSYWHFNGKVGSLSEFLARDDLWPSTWREHVERWIEHATSHNVAFVRYEDMLEDPVRELEKILRHLTVTGIAQQDIAGAIRLSSFGHMKGIEEEKGFWRPLQGEEFVRRGTRDSWKREELSATVLREFEKANADLMKRFGYADASDEVVSS